MSDRYVNRTQRPWRHFPRHLLAVLLGAMFLLGAAGVAAADDTKVNETEIEFAAPAEPDAGPPVVQQAVAIALPAGGEYPKARFRVLRPDGKALAKTAVRACRTIRLPDGQGLHRYRARRTTDAEGWFALEQDMAGRWRVEIHAPGVGWATVDLPEVTPEAATEPRTVRLQRGADISGRVVDAITGDPIEGVRVGVRLRRLSSGFRPFEPPPVRTGADGQWVLRTVPDGQWQIVAEKVTYLYREKTVTVAEGKSAGAVAFRLERKPEFRCRVLRSDGTPLSETAIRLRQLIRTADNRRAKDKRLSFKTDADGWFRLEQATGGQWQIDVILDGVGWARAGPLAVTTDRSVEPQTLTLTAGMTASGRVLEAGSGKPIEGATVAAKEQVFGGVRQFAPRAVTTDAEGRWTLTTLPPGTWALVASKDDYNWVGTEISVVDGQFYKDGHQIPKAEFRLERTPKFAGRILQQDGTPLAETQVRLVFRHDISPDRRGDYRMLKRVTTSAEGEFTCSLPKSGTWQTAVAVPGKGLAISDKIRVKPGEVTGPVVLTLRPGFKVSGTVVNKVDGKPLADVDLSCSAEASSQLIVISNVKSDAEGRWTFAGLYDAGFWQIRAEKAGYKDARATVTVAEGRNNDAVELHLARKPFLAGLILQPGGTPLADTKLRLHLSRFRRSRRQVYCDYRDSESITTDAEGRFEVDLYGAGQWQLGVRVSGKGYATSEKIKVVKGEPHPPVVLTLVRGSRIAGQVIDKATGKALAGVSVSGRFAGDNDDRPFSSLRTSAGDDGQWELADVPAGPWQLTSNKDYYVGADQVVDVKAGQDKTDVRLAMVPYVTVRGVVLGADAQTPIAKARIRREGNRDEVTTDAKGRFAIVMPPAPGQKITVLSDEYAPVEHQLVFAGDTAPPELWLILKTPGAAISGTLTDGETGKPLGNVTVLAIPITGDQWNRWNNDWFLERLHDMAPDTRFGWGPFGGMTRAQADEFGAYQIRGLGAGKYYLCVPRKDAANLVSEKVVLAEGETAAGIDLTSVKNPPGYLYGRLLKPDGTPLADTAVRFQLRAERSSYSSGIQTDGDGRFRARLRGVGQTRLTITPRKTYEAIVHTFMVANKDATLEVEFTLKPEKARGSISGRVVASDGKTGIEGLFITPASIGGEENSDAGFRWQGGGGEVFNVQRDRAAQTDAEGAFHIKNLRPGRYVLNASPRQNMGDRDEDVAKELAGLVATRSEEITVLEGKNVKDVTITVTQGGTVDGTVLDVKTGQPVAGAEVSLSLRGNNRGLEFLVMRMSSEDLQAEADDEGRFKIEGVPPGKYQLTVWADGYQYKRVSGWKSLKVKPEKTVTRTIRLTPD